jgi:aldose sugar dehydrogenase
MSVPALSAAANVSTVVAAPSSVDLLSTGASERRAREWPSVPDLVFWYAACLGLVLLLPMWRFGFVLWKLPRSQWLPFAWLAAAFVASAIAALLWRRVVSRPGLRLATVSASCFIVFSLVFLGFLLTKTEDYSRMVIAGVFAVTIMAVPTPLIVRTSRLSRAFAMAVVLVVLLGGFAYWDLTVQISRHSINLIKSAYYNLDSDTYSGVLSRPTVPGGALAPVGDRYLLLTGSGQLYVLGWETEKSDLQVTLLPNLVPINGDELSKATGRPWSKVPTEDHPREGQIDTGPEVLNIENFRTYGLLVQEVNDQVRVFVSHLYWKDVDKCWVERVSMLESERSSLLNGSAGNQWKTVYETAPCLPTKGKERRHGIPFLGYFGGGRMALLNPGTLLVTIGDFGFDGVASTEVQAQDPDTSYGKTIEIDLSDGRATMFTQGHRNPQGLFVDRSGTVWSTEHGPQGGDELNQLVAGGNYGWPYATYGTDYSSFFWPLAKDETGEPTYRDPVFAWTPSIGISNLTRVERSLFSRWRGDLLIGSLRAETLFRARLRNGRVVYVEPIVIGSRIRDVIEGTDGRILLWTDSDTLVSLRPKDAGSGEGLFAERCSGCHQTKLFSGNRIGPSLVGVVGRPVASLESYPDYSAGLRHFGGAWTPERLDEFIKAPGAIVPGTAMDFAGVSKADERAAIIGYLSTVR